MNNYNSKLIAVDIDDTVIDLMPAWLNLYNEYYYDTLTSDKIQTWNVSLYVKDVCGEKIYELLEHENLYDRVKLIPYAMSSIKKLRHIGWKVVFLTAKYNPKKIGFLKSVGLIREDLDWIVSSDKSMILADFLIDDGIHNLKSFKGEGLLFTREWNKGVKWGRRFNSWPEIVEYFTDVYGR